MFNVKEGDSSVSLKKGECNSENEISSHEKRIKGMRVRKDMAQQLEQGVKVIMKWNG